ncbi:UNVERIFIED_CONTAM: hypothetical protein FKN15_031429 [Acipenser sinensis]
MKRRKADIQDFFIEKKPQAQNRDSVGQAESTESNSEDQVQQPECSQRPSHVEQNFRGQTSAYRPGAPAICPGSQQLAKRYLPPSHHANGPQRPRARTQQLAKRYLPPSHGPSDLVRGPSSSPNDTCHLPIARRGLSDPVRGPSSSTNIPDTLPPLLVAPANSCGIPAARQTIPATFPLHAGAIATLCGVPAARQRYLAPCDCAQGHLRLCVGSQQLDKHTFHLPTTGRGLCDPLRVPSSSPNDTCQLPTLRSGPSDLVRGLISLPNNT